MKAFCKFLIVAALLVCCLATLCTLGVGAADEKPAPLSPALHVLAAGTDMRVAALVGNDYTFSKEDFARAMNLSSLEYITVTSLPDPEKGALYAGSDGVVAGQTLRASDISLLTYESATNAVGQGSFTFTVNGSAYEMTCVVYTLASINASPTLAAVPSGAMSLSVYANTPAHGVLGGYDPEGDALTFEVVKYPGSGLVSLIDPARGAYTYTPGKDFVGEDSFVYVLRDCYGNYSASATVHLRVNKQSTSVVYSDMKDSSAYNAALQMTEKGVMSGVQLGDQFYFYPNAQVSRAEFLVMAMHAAGITDVPACEKTVFYDDADIQPSMKGYVAAAYELGYISGSLENGKLCFLPNQSITRAEAAVTLNHFVGLCEVPVIPTFADGAEIPVWASDAIYSLNSVGILTETDGCIAPTSYVTRADTAKLLAAMMQYLDR